VEGTDGMAGCIPVGGPFVVARFNGVSSFFVIKKEKFTPSA